MLKVDPRWLRCARGRPEVFEMCSMWLRSLKYLLSKPEVTDVCPRWLRSD
jgi:hypothetical protein